MSEPVVRLTLLVPGVPKIDLGERIDVEWVENDGTLGEAFSFGTVPPEVVRAIEAAPGALVLHLVDDLRSGRENVLAIVEKLRGAGALAVRVEESKLGWEVSRWIELLSSDNPWSWHRAVVTFLVGDGAIQSCGMHAFSSPDVRIATDGDPTAHQAQALQELQELASAFNVYQLAEDPALVSGHTFSPDRETPRRLQRWPDTQYPPDHACHNPYGVWHLGPAGGRARPTGDLVSNFIPPLRAILTALEKKRGRALTREEIEATRDDSVCIAMKPRDVTALERGRGYADLNPELIWEQWQLVR